MRAWGGVGRNRGKTQTAIIGLGAPSVSLGMVWSGEETTTGSGSLSLSLGYHRTGTHTYAHIDGLGDPHL